jgi:hypothetical protein
MKKLIGGLAMGLMFTIIPAVAADTCATKNTKIEQLGCNLGQGTRQAYDKSREAVQQGYQNSRTWLNEHGPEIRDKAGDAARRAAEAGRKASDAAGTFLRSFREGFRR